MKLPFIHINCASSIDGRISKPDGERLRISSRKDMERVHILRNELGSILVGANTIITDDPKLTVKEEYVKDHSPLNKIVIDGKGRIPAGSRFLRTEGTSFIVTSNNADTGWMDEIGSAIEEEDLDAELIILKGDGPVLKMDRVLMELADRGIDRILVEGGSTMIGQLLNEGLFDRFTIYIGPMIIGGGGPGIVGESILDELPLKLRISGVDRSSGGILLHIDK